jgi:hypothetical protein
MNERVVIPGAGFDGWEPTARLSAAADYELDVPLSDRDDAFVVGFSKLDLTSCKP